MKAKKAIKKLIKQSKKTVKSESLKQLKSLKATPSPTRQSTTNNSSSIRGDLKELAGQVAVSAVKELAQPLNPVLSWFSEGGDYINLTTPANDSPVPEISKLRAIPTQPRSIVSLPLKSPPCKGCPALQNGVCKCAAKKFKSSA